MTALLSPRKKIFFILCTSFFCCVLSSSIAQRLEYEVIKGGKNVGHLITEKIVKGDSVFYTIESKTSIKMLLTFTVDYTLSELYVDDHLVSGTAESKLNGNSRTKSKVWIENGKYVVEVNGYEESMQTAYIDYSVPELYFSEPGNRKETFSQQFAENLIIKKDKEHVYTLYSEDGRNTHTYVNGVCTHVKLNRTYASFYFRLKQ